MHHDLSKTDILEITLRGDLFCTYGFRELIRPDTFETGKPKSQLPIHDDFRTAWVALTPHLPIILKDLDPKDIPDINSDISGQGYSDQARAIIPLFRLINVEYDPDEKWVILHGTKQLELGSMAFTTPEIKLEGSYHFALELRLGIDTLIEEVKQYTAGKCAPHYEQTTMFGDGDEDTSKQAEEAPPKRPRGRPKKEKGVDFTITTTDSGGNEVDVTARILGEGNRRDDDDTTEVLTSEPLTNFQIDPSLVQSADEEL